MTDLEQPDMVLLRLAIAGADDNGRLCIDGVRKTEARGAPTGVVSPC
jgi:hypothetical protein